MSASFVQLPSEILIDPNISALDLRIYAICLDFGRKSKGFTQIGHQHLGRLVAKHPQTIAKSIKRLTKLGYIKVERIGLNRNDRIRCQKTVRRENSTEVRSERVGKIKETSQHSVPHLVDKRKKKRYKEPSAILPANQSKQTASTPPKTLPDQPRSTQTIAEAKSHQPLTDRLSDKLSQAIRPATFTNFFKNMAVIEDDEGSMTISVGHQVEWIENHYSDLLDNLADKKVLIVA